MTAIPTADYLADFSQALVSEIKADMGRRDLSMRGLATLLGENPQYVTSRLGGGNPRTGKRVDLSVADLFVIASALGTDAWALLDRAEAVAGPVRYMQLPSTPAEVADDKRLAEEAMTEGPRNVTRLERTKRSGQPKGAAGRSTGRRPLYEFDEEDEAARNEDAEAAKIGDDG